MEIRLNGENEAKLNVEDIVMFIVSNKKSSMFSLASFSPLSRVSIGEV
jgi:hypothetical protein